MVQKETEYPQIKWDNLADPDVQRAVIIYNDRVNTYRKMKEIDPVIDKNPTEQRIIDLAELRNRNLLAFKELKTFNDKGKWLNKHPLLRNFSIKTKYSELLRKNPTDFLAEYTNTANNVNRYKSFLNNKDRSPNQHEKDRDNLKKHYEREEIMREVLEESRK